MKNIEDEGQTEKEENRGGVVMGGGGERDKKQDLEKRDLPNEYWIACFLMMRGLLRGH